MIMLSKMAYEALSKGNERIPMNPKELWKRSKPATIWLFICMILEIPLTIIKCIIMAVCFIPYKVYETLEDI